MSANTSGWTDSQGNWHSFCKAPPSAKLWAMVRVDTRGRIVERMVASDARRMTLAPHWRTDYQLGNDGEAMTCEHGHPNCGIGSTLCGDEHQ